MGERVISRLIQLIRGVGLARLVRLNVIGAIPPIWLEIVILHFRGSFQNRFMWIPIVSLPLALVGGVASSLIAEERQARAIFGPAAWLMAIVGTIGTYFHLRGIGRQMGGYYNWKYNVITGPPFPAPPQVALYGLLGILASASPSRGETGRLIGWVRAVEALGYVLLAIEAGYSHWIGEFRNKVMYTPLTLGPLLSLVHLAALARLRLAQLVEGPLSAVATIAGLIGFGFHIWNISRRSGGFRWQNFFYGPPVVAPLQMTGQGLLGLLAALFGSRR